MGKSITICTGVIVVGAVMASLLIQRRDQARQRENNALLRQQENQLAKLATENQRLSNLVVQTRTNSVLRPDDPTAELAHLRAKVEALRQQTNQLAELPRQLAEKRLLAGAQAFYSGDFNLLEHNRESAITMAGGPRATGKLNDARALTAALRKYADEHQGEFPLNLDQVGAYLPKALEADSPPWANAPPTATKDFEIVYQGSLDKLQGIPRGTVAVIRDQQTWEGPDGKMMRVYGMADGVGQTVGSDDNFQSWEAKHIISPLKARQSGRQRSAADYFTAERSLPWWAVMFSIVATETSTLTVISVPGVAYLGSFSFVELAVGYLIGRILVAFVLLPLYFRGGFVSAYQYLGQRFGRQVQALASVTFLITRLLAEGVRLFAGAIPIKLLLAEFGVNINYFVIVLAITAVTVAYTYVGGIKAVVWTDFLQMALYLAGAVVCIVVLLGQVGLGGLGTAYQAGKLTVFNFDAPILTSPYAFVTAIVGGALLTMGSHGSDQLIAQRVLSCRSLSDGRKAMIGSAVAVGIQFALFSLVGALLWVASNGASLQQLGLRSDQIFGDFILRGLPVGLSGLLVAGILAAIATNVSYSNWYGFPCIYTASYMFIQFVGFICVGLVAGLLLGKTSQPIVDNRSPSAPATP